ncbi:UBX domain-containing protein 1-A [Fasciola hepatica]|uniref:UBX domain-containing protein 1-A n=1 Tax=Fasciola hepatica TaxID=6192 RepID=A0A4E0RA53_FASHE|nr:UBX domain-containing protein 1-A [Fasciola hepatica]
MSSDLQHLLDMGFPQATAEEALQRTGYKSLDAAVDWIAENEKLADTAVDRDEKATALLEVQGYKCEDCQKTIQNAEELQMHSALTGHCNYTELSDKAALPTEEERKAQMEKLQHLIKQRRQMREEQDSRTELEREKMRRRQGKDLISAKAKFESDEMRRIAEQKTREKAEDKAYREKLRAEIAREREEKKLREVGSLPVAQPPPAKVEPAPPDSTSTSCRLQIRLPSGNPLKAEFGALEPLSAVALYISQKWPNATPGLDPTSIRLFTTFPKHEYDTDDLQKPLRELGLCPSAVLHAKIHY